MTLFFFKGFGTLLMEEAERIAKEEHGSTKISVISGIGTRDYYRKLGYGIHPIFFFFSKSITLHFRLELDGPYMSKSLI